MQTIETKYHGATNVRGSRISATASGASIRICVSYDHSLNSEDNHKAAALQLMDKLNWHGQYIGGHTKSGMVFVNNDSRFDYSISR